jgi:hypothetical protein
MDFRERLRSFERMADDELLNVAANFHTLVPEGQSALAAELDKRKLTQEDIKEYQRHLTTVNPGDLPGKVRFVARSFNGFGSAIYGKRDCWSDGSFITTKWVVFLWIPILPVRSMRVRPMGRAGAFSTSYQIYSDEKLYWKQVFCAYAVVALALLLFILCLKYGFPDELLLGLFLGLIGVVWLLRRKARARSTIPDAKGRL